MRPLWANPGEAANRDERKPIYPYRREGWDGRAKERQKRKSRPWRACKGSELKHGLASKKNGISNIREFLTDRNTVVTGSHGDYKYLIKTLSSTV